MRGAVIGDLAERRRAAGAALVEDDDAIARRVEETTMGGRRAGTGAAMQEDDRNAARIARLLPIERVPRIDGQGAGRVGFDRGKQVAAAHRGSSQDGSGTLTAKRGCRNAANR